MLIDLIIIALTLDILSHSLRRLCSTLAGITYCEWLVLAICTLITSEIFQQNVIIAANMRTSVHWHAYSNVVYTKPIKAKNKNECMDLLNEAFSRSSSITEVLLVK